MQKLLNNQYVEEIIDVNGMSMQELICKLVSCFLQIIGTIQANDQQHNYCIRDSLYDVFANVIKTSDPELVGGIVSEIVEDYINSPLEYQNAKAHGCFAHFVRRSVNTELRLQLSSEIITSTAQNLIEYGDEIPSVEVGIFELISAVVLCASKLEEFDTAIIEPLEQVIEWCLCRNSETTIEGAVSCVMMIINSFDTAFSAAFMLLKMMLEAMMYPIDNLLFNVFCHLAQKMMSLHHTLETGKEQLLRLQLILFFELSVRRHSIIVDEAALLLMLLSSW